MKNFPDDLQTLLKQQATVLHPDVRMVCSTCTCTFVYVLRLGQIVNIKFEALLRNASKASKICMCF